MTANPASLNGESLQVSLTAKDLQKSMAWYVDVLGFTLDRRIERDGALRGFALSAGNVRVNLNQDDGAKGWTRTKGEGFSLRLNTTQDVDELARRIRELGGSLDMEPKDMAWGARIFTLRDPDGFKWIISRAHAA
jgi:uncharacterized glyoxalase superfamily protein PhnB